MNEKPAQPRKSNSDPVLTLGAERRHPNALSLVIEERDRLRAAAQDVVDCSPGYTAKNASIWPLDHALDRLREVLNA